MSETTFNAWHVVNMDYRKQYDILIEQAMERNGKDDTYGYTEAHHIIPLCMGGNDSWQNKVRLWPEEHFIAHMLLKMIYPNNRKICYAFDMMSCHGHMNHNVYGSQQRGINSTEYNHWRWRRDRIPAEWYFWFNDYYCRLEERIRHPELFGERTIYHAHEWFDGRVTPAEDDRWIITGEDIKGIKRDKEFDNEIAARIYVDAVMCCKYSGRFNLSVWNKFAPDHDSEISRGFDPERDGEISRRFDPERDEDESEYYWT